LPAARFPGPHLRTRRASHPGTGLSPSPRPLARRAPMCAGFAVPAVHGVPVFTRNLLPFQPHPGRLAASLRPVPGSPGLRLLRRLRHARTPSADGEPAHHGGRRQALPTFPVCRSTRAVPSCIPAASPPVRRRPSRWPPARPCAPRSESPAGMISAGVRCNPAHIRQIQGRSSTYGTSTLVPRVHLLVLLAGPGPSGSADPSRRCRGCSHPP
jgi:hypothetical protein